MNDSGLFLIVKKLLGAKTKKAALDFVAEYVGDDYLRIAKELAERLTYGRTLSQNALLHKWYGEIAKHYGDRTLDDVKGECHRRWALGIRMADRQFAYVWAHTGAKMDYKKQCSLLASGVLNVSSAMTTKELSDYMNEIEQFYRPQGVALTIPEEAE